MSVRVGLPVRRAGNSNVVDRFRWNFQEGWPTGHGRTQSDPVTVLLL